MIQMMNAGAGSDGPLLWPVLPAVFLPSAALVVAVLLVGVGERSPWLAFWAYIVPPIVGLALMLPRRTAPFGFGLVAGSLIAPAATLLVLWLIWR
ncbi:MAG: hypothetical protein QOI95_3178 [Acidimicrobiaceae bacterium]